MYSDVRRIPENQCSTFTDGQYFVFMIHWPIAVPKNKLVINAAIQYGLGNN